SLLMRLLEGLAAAGVREAAVVVGFDEDAVRAAVGAGPHGIRVRCLSNPRFREGAVLSLWTARELLDGPVLLMDADVLCAPGMIARLVGSPHRNCFLLDAGVEVTGEEQMLLVRGERVLDIVRGGAPGYELAGESVGFLRLAAGAARVLRELLELRVAAGHTATEHEEAYPDLLERGVAGLGRARRRPTRASAARSRPPRRSPRRPTMRSGWWSARGRSSIRPWCATSRRAPVRGRCSRSRRTARACGSRRDRWSPGTAERGSAPAPERSGARAAPASSRPSSAPSRTRATGTSTASSAAC